MKSQGNLPLTIDPSTTGINRIVLPPSLRITVVNLFIAFTSSSLKLVPFLSFFHQSTFTEHTHGFLREIFLTLCYRALTFTYCKQEQNLSKSIILFTK